MTQRYRSSSSSNTTLWVALGAAAGLVAGVMLAGGGNGRGRLLRRLSSVLRMVEGTFGDGPRGQADGAEGDEREEMEDEDLEHDDETDAPRIDERVLAAFLQDPVLAERNIEIDEPEPGVIVLSGRVPYDDDVAHSMTIARGVPGVTHVENHVRVRTRPRPAPRTRSGA